MAKKIVFNEEARKSLLKGIDAVADAEQRLRDGYVVFHGPVVDNTGKERIADGEELSIEEANSMQWFYPNVIDNWADKPE